MLSTSLKVTDLKRGDIHRVEVIPGRQLVKPELFTSLPSWKAPSCKEKPNEIHQTT